MYFENLSLKLLLDAVIDFYLSTTDKYRMFILVTKDLLLDEESTAGLTSNWTALMQRIVEYWKRPGEKCQKSLLKHRGKKARQHWKNKVVESIICILKYRNSPIFRTNFDDLFVSKENLSYGKFIWRLLQVLDKKCSLNLF